MANWKINCMEDDYPGLWHTWFREQVVAVGWPPPEFGLHTANAPHDWSLARRYLQQVAAGDKVIVQLKNWRVGRIGTVLDNRSTCCANLLHTRQQLQYVSATRIAAEVRKPRFIAQTFVCATQKQPSNPMPVKFLTPQG